MLLGSLLYYLSPRLRKIALSNLALSDLALTEVEIRRMARRSLGHLITTYLEYPRLARLKKASEIAYCVNPEEAERLIASGQGVIFFCGHQSNWELLFLEGTSRMPGVAIGRPVRQKQLYRWVVSIREKFGGKVILPKEAVKEGLRALRSGKFLGVVGDQGMPDQGYRAPFLGRMAYTSPLPALLCYRTGAPLMTATIHRENERGGHHYQIRYSAPIWPDRTKSSEEEIPRLMREASTFLESGIRAHPDQWLWAHNRWKQQSLGTIKRRYRYDSLLVVLGKQVEPLVPLIQQLRRLYPQELFAIWAEEGSQLPDLPEVELRYYRSLDELMKPDLRYKLLFNFSGSRALTRQLKRGAVIEALEIEDNEELMRRICHAR